jgi:hypothetical protein
VRKTPLMSKLYLKKTFDVFRRRESNTLNITVTNSCWDEFLFKFRPNKEKVSKMCPV